jgi:hypothetical protein
MANAFMIGRTTQIKCKLVARLLRLHFDAAQCIALNTRQAPSFFEREFTNFADAYFLVRRQLIRQLASLSFGSRSNLASVSKDFLGQPVFVYRTLFVYF